LLPKPQNPNIQKFAQSMKLRKSLINLSKFRFQQYSLVSASNEYLFN